MTAQPVTDDEAAANWRPDPARQKRADYTVEDVLNLPPHAPRMELDDGVASVVPSPSISHQRIGFLLASWLHRHAPRRFRAVTAVGVMVGLQKTLEPDVLLYDSDAVITHHYLEPAQIALAIEIVSPGTRKQDRLVKPIDYGRAGIPFYWRIEQDPVHVFAYRLSKDSGYDLMAESTELLEVSEPFAIKLPIEEIMP